MPASQHRFGACDSLRGGVLWTEGRVTIATLVLSVAKMLSKWSPPARLETRTKESNMYASIRVANPCAQ